MADPVASGERLVGTEHPEGATIAFYDREADTYFRSTLANDLSDLYRLFLSQLRTGGLILDAGSGSGRDTLVFLDAGFGV